MSSLTHQNFAVSPMVYQLNLVKKLKRFKIGKERTSDNFWLLMFPMGLRGGVKPVSADKFPAAPNVSAAQNQIICHYPFIYLVERGTVGVKCHAEEHNTMSPVRALT